MATTERSGALKRRVGRGRDGRGGGGGEQAQGRVGGLAYSKQRATAPLRRNRVGGSKIKQGTGLFFNSFFVLTTIVLGMPLLGACRIVGKDFAKRQRFQT
jgi:hypothetical protein